MLCTTIDLLGATLLRLLFLPLLLLLLLLLLVVLLVLLQACSCLCRCQRPCIESARVAIRLLLR